MSTRKRTVKNYINNKTLYSNMISYKNSVEEAIRENKDKKEAVQDVLWALVTSREFYFNH